MPRHPLRVTLALLLLVPTAFAQTVTISGQVTDAQTRESLPREYVYDGDE